MPDSAVCMTPPKKWPWILSSGLCGMLLAAGCASEKSHKWLTFFFDGAPGSKGASTPSQPGYSPGQTTNLISGRAPLREEPPLVVHPPYAERKCVECHASNYSQRLKGDVSAIFTACHKKFLVKAKYTHAPMVDGQCNICHEPHQAKEKFLLVKSSRELCFDCHEPKVVLQIAACRQSEARICTECHNPHQENKRFLLHTLGEKALPALKPTPDK
jgi:predicted CXXCH cytochrome family protein